MELEPLDPFIDLYKNHKTEISLNENNENNNENENDNSNLTLNNNSFLSANIVYGETCNMLTENSNNQINEEYQRDLLTNNDDLLNFQTNENLTNLNYLNTLNTEVSVNKDRENSLNNNYNNSRKNLKNKSNKNFNKLNISNNFNSNLNETNEKPKKLVRKFKVNSCDFDNIKQNKYLAKNNMLNNNLNNNRDRDFKEKLLREKEKEKEKEKKFFNKIPITPIKSLKKPSMDLSKYKTKIFTKTIANSNTNNSKDLNLNRISININKMKSINSNTIKTNAIRLTNINNDINNIKKINSLNKSNDSFLLSSSYINNNNNNNNAKNLSNKKDYSNNLKLKNLKTMKIINVNNSLKMSSFRDKENNNNNKKIYDVNKSNISQNKLNTSQINNKNKYRLDLSVNNINNKRDKSFNNEIKKENPLKMSLNSNTLVKKNNLNISFNNNNNSTISKNYKIENFGGKKSMISTISEKKTNLNKTMKNNNNNSIIKNETKKNFNFSNSNSSKIYYNDSYIAKTPKKNNPLNTNYSLTSRKTIQKENKDNSLIMKKNFISNTSSNFKKKYNEAYLEKLCQKPSRKIKVKDFTKTKSFSSSNNSNNKLKSNSIISNNNSLLSSKSSISNKGNLPPNRSITIKGKINTSNFNSYNSNNNTKKGNKIDLNLIGDGEYNPDKAKVFFSQIKDNFDMFEKKFYNFEEYEFINDDLNKLKKLEKYNTFLNEFFSLISVYYKSLLQRKDAAEMKQKRKSIAIKTSKVNIEHEKEKEDLYRLEKVMKEYSNLLKDYEYMISNNDNGNYMINQGNTSNDNNDDNKYNNKNCEELCNYSFENFNLDDNDNNNEENYTYNEVQNFDENFTQKDKDHILYIENLLNLMENNFINSEGKETEKIEIFNDIIDKITDQSKLNIDLGKKNIELIKQNDKTIFELSKHYYALQEKELESFYLKKNNNKINKKDQKVNLINKFESVKILPKRSKSSNNIWRTSQIYKLNKNFLEDEKIKNRYSCINFLESPLKHLYDKYQSGLLINDKDMEKIPFEKNPKKRKYSEDTNNDNIVTKNFQRSRSLQPKNYYRQQDQNDQQENHKFNKSLSSSFRNSWFEDKQERNQYISNFNIDLDNLIDEIFLNKNDKKYLRRKEKEKNKKELENSEDINFNITDDGANNNTNINLTNFSNENFYNENLDINNSHVDIINMYKIIGKEITKNKLGMINVSSKENLLNEKKTLKNCKNDSIYRSQEILYHKDPEEYFKKKNKFKTLDSLKKQLNGDLDERSYIEDEEQCLSCLKIYETNQEEDFDDDFYDQILDIDI